MSGGSRDLKFKVSQDGASKVASEIGAIEKPVSNLKDRFGSLSETSLKVGTAISAGAVMGTAAIYTLVGAAAEAEANQKMLEHAVISVSHGTEEQVAALQALATQVMANGVLDDDAIIRGQAQLSTFGLQTQSVYDLTQSMADLAVNQYGVNASGQDLEATANMMSKALRGEFGVLEKSGIIFNEAQKNMILYGTEAEKVSAIQEGFAQNLKFTNEVAAQTISGAMANLQNQFGTFQESLGTAMIPTLMSLAEMLGNVAEWLNSLDPSIVDIVAKVILFGTAIMAVVGPFLILLSMIPSIIAGVQAIGVAITLMTGPIGLVIMAVIALGILIYTQWDVIKEYTFAAWGAIKEFFSGLWEWMKETFYNFVITFIAVLALLFPPFLLVLHVIKEHWDELVAGFKMGLDLVITFFTESWTFVRDFTIAAFTAVADYFIATWEGIKSFLGEVLDAFLGMFGTNTETILVLWDGLWSSFSGVINSYIDAIKGVVSGLMTYLSDKITAITDAVQKAWASVRDLASGAVEAATGIGPSSDGATAHFATGGIVTSPTMALIGEGAYNEAVVPLPDGRSIPVEMKGGVSGGNTFIAHQGDVIIQSTQDVDAYFQKMKKRFIEEMQMQKLGSVTV